MKIKMVSSMIVRRNLIAVLFTTFSFCSYSQNPNTGLDIAKMQWQAKQVIPPSPEAAELGKYGNVPVSLFTGTPNISIPLFELKGNSLSLPLSLSYNASGFKPEDAASWVGSGWALNAGGVITRAAMGNPDKDNNYFNVPNVLNPPLSSDVFDYYTYMQNIQSGIIETQPDVYYYNFAGHSGKFLLKPDYSVFKKERNLSKIIPCISNSCTASKFSIVDEQGIIYEFEAIETTHMTPYDDAGNLDPNPYHFVSAWFLSKMTSADGNETVEFEYYSTTGSHELYSNTEKNKSYSYTYGYKLVQGGCSECVSQYTGSEHRTPLVTIDRKFLKKITFKKLGTLVAFAEINSATGQRDDSNFGEDRRVNNVKLFSVWNGSDNLTKQFNFSYGYFGNTAATGGLAYLEKRLRLDNVQEISTNSNTPSPPPHVFSYNDGFGKRFTTDLDHWGFYNAAGNSNLVPNVPISPSGTVCSFASSYGGNANRSPSLEGSKATMISKIEYPTGGHTLFTYELNKGKYYPDNTVNDLGGVRISEMIDYSSSTKKAISKKYLYLNDDGVTSSGRSGVAPIYKKVSTFEHFFDNGCNSPLNGCDCSTALSGNDYILTTVTISANSIVGLGSFQGSHVGYEQVTEIQSDVETNQALGKTVYNYTTGFYSEYDDHIANGDLTKKTVYRGDGKKLQEVTSAYNYFGPENIKGQMVKADDYQSNKILWCRYGTTNTYHNYLATGNPPSGCSNVHSYPTRLNLEYYIVLRQHKRLSIQTTIIWDELSNAYLTTTKNFTYGSADHDYPTLIEEVNSTGEKIGTTLKYVQDYSGSATGTMADNIRHMNLINIVGLPVEKLQYRENANGSNRRYISGQLTDYYYGNPLNVYFLQAQPLLTSVLPSHISSTGQPIYFNSNYRLAASVMYDIVANPVQQAKTNDVKSVTIWGYKKRYPVAQITGSDIFTVNGLFNQSVLDNPSSTEAQVAAELNNIRTGLASTSAQVITYTFKPLVGISSQTDARGRTVYYEYDGLNRLKLVRDHESNILKKVCYNYWGQTDNCTCTITTADWQNTATALRCQVSGGVNTGYQEREQKDMNPCSPTYNTTQWVQAGYNTTICPPPSNCNSGNCSGDDKKCINGICETGVLKIISTRRTKLFIPTEEDPLAFVWVYYCTTAYCFSDATMSTPVENTSSGFCTPQSCL